MFRAVGAGRRGRIVWHPQELNPGFRPSPQQVVKTCLARPATEDQVETRRQIPASFVAGSLPESGDIPIAGPDIVQYRIPPHGVGIHRCPGCLRTDLSAWTQTNAWTSPMLNCPASSPVQPFRRCARPRRLCPTSRPPWRLSPDPASLSSGRSRSRSDGCAIRHRWETRRESVFLDSFMCCIQMCATSLMV